MWAIVRSATGSGATVTDTAAPGLDPELRAALVTWLGATAANGAPHDAPDTGGGTALAGFVDGQVATERDRRNQINARGSGLITTATSLATLLFASSALVTAAKTFVLPRLALWALAQAFLTFVGAALCGIMSTRTIRYDVVAPDQLERWRARDDVWGNSQSQVQRLLTKANVLTLRTLRAGNNAKMRWVRVGFWTQVGALGALAIAVGAILVAAIFPQWVGFAGMLTHVG